VNGGAAFDLAAVAGVFGRHQVSIRSMEQESLLGGVATAAPLDGAARLIFITHEATERDVQACLSDLRRLEPVGRVASVLRVIGTD